MNLANQHIAELTLRRRRAGEALGADAPAIEEHATTCADCRARIRALDDEQRRFEDDISFDRFSAGVERAAFREQTGFALDALAGERIAELVGLGLLEDDGQRVRLTRAGKFVADGVIERLM